ncbi:MAG: hypothetical protein V2A65_11375 [Candidatus Omnitrophota bacterium]
MKACLTFVSMVVLCLLCTGSVVNGEGTFNPGTEPDGFRNMTWGTDISAFDGLELLRDDPEKEYVYVLKEYQGVKIYKRNGDEYMIGDNIQLALTGNTSAARGWSKVPEAPIEWYFKNDKFCGVHLITGNYASGGQSLAGFLGGKGNSNSFSDP